MIYACTARGVIFALTGNIHLAREAHRLRAKSHEILKNITDVLTADEHMTICSNEQELLIFDREIEPNERNVAENTRALVDRIPNEKTVAE